MTNSKAFIVFACLIPLACSLQCYICNSKNDTDTLNCSDNSKLSEIYLKDCDAQEQPVSPQQNGVDLYNMTICRKIVTWVDFKVRDNGPTMRIQRQCGYIKSKYDNECYYRGGFGGRQQVCSCTEDKCNHGNVFQINCFLMIGVIMVVLAEAVRLH